MTSRVETIKEMLDRLDGMVNGDGAWNLDERDRAAIGFALAVVRALPEGSFAVGTRLFQPRAAAA